MVACAGWVIGLVLAGAGNSCMPVDRSMVVHEWRKIARELQLPKHWKAPLIVRVCPRISDAYFTLSFEPSMTSEGTLCLREEVELYATTADDLPSTLHDALFELATLKSTGAPSGKRSQIPEPQRSPRTSARCG